MGVEIADDFAEVEPPVPMPQPHEWGARPPVDDEEQRLTDANRLAGIVQTQFDLLKGRAIARARLLAESEADQDYDSLFLNRDQLRDLPAADPLIEGVLDRHSYAILRGRDHSYKSFAAIDWTCCLATGKPWQGRASEQVRVLYIVGEGAHGIARRIDAWEYAWQTPLDPHTLTIRKAALNLHTPGPAFDHLLQVTRAGGYGLVIIDTLRRVSGSADANSSEMGAVVDNIDRLTGVVVALPHESTHSGTVRLQPCLRRSLKSMLSWSQPEGDDTSGLRPPGTRSLSVSRDGCRPRRRDFFIQLCRQSWEIPESPRGLPRRSLALPGHSHDAVAKLIWATRLWADRCKRDPTGEALVELILKCLNCCGNHPTTMPLDRR